MEAVKYNRSEIMKKAHTLYRMMVISPRKHGRTQRNGRVYTWGECLRMAWNFAKDDVRRAAAKEVRKVTVNNVVTNARPVVYGESVNNYISRMYAGGAYMGD